MAMSDNTTKLQTLLAAIQALPEAVTKEEIQAVVTEALEEAKASGDFDGEDGADGKTAYQYAQDGGYTGTEAEFAAKLAAPLIVPEMYGAKGDGVTDDSAAIQAAINANALVVIPPKTYVINSPITIPSNRKVQLDGEVKVTGEAGFVITGSHIEICGNGSISLPPSNLACTAIRFLVAGSVFFVTLRDFTIFGSYSTSGVQQQSIAIEFIGNETEGQCAYIKIGCTIRSTYRGIYSHAAEGQHESSWFTQANIDAFVEQCVIAYDFEWEGGASQIRGAIQPRCNAAEAGQTDATLITLPMYCYFDAMIWDVDTARNNLILSIPKKGCTVWSVLDEQYMSIGEVARKTLVLRKPNDEIMSNTGGVFSGDVSFAGRQVGLMLEKPDGTVERVMVQQNGLVTAGLVNYTNQLPLATDTDRTTIYGDSATPGYKANYRLSSSGAVVAHDGCYTTGFIPAVPGSVIRVKNITITSVQNLYFIAYNASNEATGHAQWNGAGNATIALQNLGNGLYNLTATLDPAVYGTGFNAIRISSGGFNEDTIITVNEEIDDTFDIVKSINGMTGDVQIAIPDVPVKSVNGQTGDVQIDVPTVAEWAQASSKPTYTASEVGAAPASQTLTLTGVDADGVTHTWTVYGVKQ